MDSPNLEDLRDMCSRPMKSGGRLEPKHRKSVEACWDGISTVAFQYLSWISKPWPHATPKEAEGEWDDVATAANELMNALRRLSTKSLGLAWGFSKQVAKKKPGNSFAAALSPQCADPLEEAWIGCNGFEWFLKGIPREMRKEGPGMRFRSDAHENQKFIKSRWDDICDGKGVRQLSQVRTLAEHFKGGAAAIKEKRTKEGFGATWGKDPWEEDPEGTMCRGVRQMLRDNNQYTTHANAIAREIYIWAHPDMPEDKWPTAVYFGVRRLK